MFAKKSNGRVLVKIVVVLLVLAAAGVLVSRSLQSTARVKLVSRDNAVDVVTGSVAVSADGGYKEVKSEVGGRVLDSSAINKGEHFKAGATLVQLDTADIDRQIKETQRDYDTRMGRLEIELKDNPEKTVAEDALKTAKRLYELGNVSEEQLKTAQRTLAAIEKRFELAEFDRKKAKADYDATMESLTLTKKKMTIPAPPMDGEVQAPLTWDGALIGPGQPVAIVFSNKRIVAAKISEESFGKVKIGQRAKLRLLTYGSQEFEATVSKLLPTADEAQRFEVWLEVKVDDPQMLKPGSTGEVTITVDTHPNQPVIQRRALIGNDSVFVVENGVVRRRPVKVGYMALNVVEIREGLKDGEQVIVDMLDEFREGQRVKVQVIN
jgi:RND family efflux transporter MFP subunit